MHNPAAVLENDTHKLLWDFDIHTDHLTRRSDRLIIKKKKKKKKKGTGKIVDFAVNKIKLKESEKKDKYLELAWELKKTMEHGGDNYTNCNWRFW